MTHRRPLEIQLIALAYVVSPLGNIMQALITWHNLSMDAVKHYIITALGVSSVLLLVAPIVGFGIYMARRWGYYLFFAHATLVLMHHGQYVMSEHRAAAAPYIVLNLALFAVVLYMMRKDQRAPYLADDPRGWRLAERIECVLPVTLHVGSDAPVHGVISNLSKTGVLATLASPNVRVGDTVDVTVGTAGNELRTQAFIVWVAEASGTMGLQFLSLKQEQEAHLLHLATAGDRGVAPGKPTSKAPAAAHP